MNICKVTNMARYWSSCHNSLEDCLEFSFELCSLPDYNIIRFEKWRRTKLSEVSERDSSTNLSSKFDCVDMKQKSICLRDQERGHQLPEEEYTFTGSSAIRGRWRAVCKRHEEKKGNGQEGLHDQWTRRRQTTQRMEVHNKRRKPGKMKTLMKQWWYF